MTVVVLGSGVSGLTCAVALLESGSIHPSDLSIWTRDLGRTASSVAPAFWFPFLVGPDARVLRWAEVAYARFVALAEDPATGIRLHEAFDLARGPIPRPWWAEVVPNVRPAAPASLPPGFTHGWVFDAPIIDTRRYLPWLRGRIESAGVVLEIRSIESWDEALEHHDVVINCTGLGARLLCNDRALVPIRGQLLHVADPGIDRVLLDEHEPGRMAYVVPRGDQLVLGGTISLEDEDADVRSSESQSIREQCAVLDPRIATAHKIEDVVGIRPGRDRVRLASETPRPGKLIVHDYGHGGAGVTLSWGCAADVVELVLAHREGRGPRQA